MQCVEFTVFRRKSQKLIDIYTADTLCRISKALSVSCDYIMLGEDAGSGGKEKIICVLEKLEPKQTSKIQDILKILSELCEVN